MLQGQKLHLTLSAPSLKDNTATIDRLAKAVRQATGQWPVVSVGRAWPLAQVIRQAGGDVTASLVHGPAGLVLVDVEPGDQSATPVAADILARVDEVPAGPWGQSGLGVALDIGSTHLQATLHDLASGQELAKGTLMNPQTAVGSDILTRIHAAASPEGAQRLHGMLVGAAQELIERMCAQAGRRTAEVVGMVAAGNTTMTHFFLGLDSQSICREPYIPVINRPAPFFASHIGLALAEGAVVWCMPNVGAYFGGDLVAGIVAAGLHQREDVAILVDVGTNAEVVVGNRDWLIACAGAAGPALESGVAKRGVLAQPGAIEGVVIDPQTFAPTLRIIPDADGRAPKPKGLCGSGLLQLLAQLYLTRAMDMRGKLTLADHPRLVVDEDGVRGYLVVPAADSASGESIVIDEIEIDILLRSKAAMYTILRTVLLEVGLQFEDLSAFFVAGAFGAVIDPETAITLGMLPDLPRERFVTLGNSSLSGCQRLLLEPAARPQVEAVTDKLTYLELNVNQMLMNRFSAARFIPHTDASRFPSVPAYH
ncbi:iron-sulfur cluster binding protein [Desulfarculus baarsii DSM 2075]|uniref:Iron-sulfur cluster binding protein n=1 Tax=Desulfarculus baarsii (strain ATCC 33931 / DSM 2075 / LMG 7858 / VKM B-1802 / 2st14) TaxID=644282 RepID=E1QJN9_DESB2|nr:ASKHA domain-containing protein [Desulfarculus baarsii]ADK85782.1 iron-sulfur cluster binding protein [Desulfarculus baarsii DSM 2075]